MKNLVFKAICFKMEKWKFSEKNYLGIFENGHFKNVQNEKPRRLYFPVFSQVW